MTKIPETQARLFHNVFVCRKCKAKIRSSMSKILKEKVRCRRCGSKALRPIKKVK